MARKPKFNPRAALFGRRGEFVRIAGEPVSIGHEVGEGPRHNDHVWVTIHAGRFGRLRIAVNTLSVRNLEAGFDPGVRVGIVRETWARLPKSGVFACRSLDYSQIERSHDVPFEHCLQRAAEEHIVARARAAIFVEAWGDLYIREHPGIHQVHSRRASCAVPRDIVGRDGALRFYFGRDTVCETLLFKFCGQP